MVFPPEMVHVGHDKDQQYRPQQAHISGIPGTVGRTVVGCITDRAGFFVAQSQDQGINGMDDDRTVQQVGNHLDRCKMGHGIGIIIESLPTIIVK